MKRKPIPKEVRQKVYDKYGVKCKTLCYNL